MHTRETRKRERERDVKENAKARNENLQCALIDACPASHDCMYFCRVNVCVCLVSCVDLLVTSLYQRGCLSKRVNLPGWQFFADNVST